MFAGAAILACPISRRRIIMSNVALTTADLPRIHEYLKWIVNAHDYVASTQNLRDLGLLEGIQLTVGSTFFKRLQKEKSQKRALAKYSMEQCGLAREVERNLACPTERPAQLFFECGS